MFGNFFRRHRARPAQDQMNTPDVCVPHRGGGRGRRNRNQCSSEAPGRRGICNLKEDESLLSECREGDRIVLRFIIGRGPIRRRLLEMGMNPGTEIRVVKYAPLKDPIECEIKGYHIALRVAEARHIVVTQPEQPM